MPDAPVVTILCSGVALGVYVPALLLRHQLRVAGLRADAVVLEDLYSSAGLRAIERVRSAFHDRFELARIALRMTTSQRPELERSQVEALLAVWHEEGRRDFVVWSGFWMPLLEEYRARCAPQPIRVDVCRIDAVVSASFRGSVLHPDDREIWFWSWHERRLEHELSATPELPLPFPIRDDRLVVHGGGWGLGGYQEAAAELMRAGTAVDRVVYRTDEVAPGGDGSRTFMVRPDWRPWLRPAGGEPELPPFGDVSDGLDGAGRFTNRPECHELYRLVRRSRGIVSKPGGGTLLDSLSSATPVVFLEPYGEPERRNAELWISLGFGIWLDDWRGSGYDGGLLARLHGNLLSRVASTTDYPRAVADRMGHGPDGGVGG